MKNRFALLSFVGRDGALSKIHELIREMKVSQVMTTSLYTLSPDATMSELKELLREHRMSGVPVVKDGTLLGIVSIEDLIHSMERGELYCPVSAFMTSKNLIVAHENEQRGAPRALSHTGDSPLTNSPDPFRQLLGSKLAALF